MNVADLGEFPLIERLRQIIGVNCPDLIVGIGDDAAVLADGPDTYLLATVDSHIENIHFLPFLTTPHQLGRRALVVNVSDIAAMGGQPQFALVSLALPAYTQVTWIEEFYKGMRGAADQAGVVVIGGNVTRSLGGINIDITLLGRVPHEHLLLRSGARPGDKLLVTDRVGDAFSGLQLVFNPRLAVDPIVRETLITRYLEPEVRLREASMIARSGLATAMIDVSDGLSSDIGHICQQSGVGVRIWADHLPISPSARQVADAMQTPALRLALDGGDDYGLCFTVRPESVAQLQNAIEQETGKTVTVIGEILPIEQGNWLVLSSNQEIPLESTGWQHFQSTNGQSPRDGKQRV